MGKFPFVDCAASVPHGDFASWWQSPRGQVPLWSSRSSSPIDPIADHRKAFQPSFVETSRVL